MNLTLTLDEEICILDKYGLTSDELLVIRVLLILQDDNKEDLFHRLLVTMKQNNISLRDLLKSLQDKGVILKSWKIPQEGSSFDPYIIPINKNFIKNLYKSSFELGKELFEVYPQFGTINNCIIPLRGVSKHFNSLEDAYFKYGKNINWNPEKHEYIISLVNYGKENNLINMSLASFIINNSWLDLEAMKNGDANNRDFNSIKLI